MRRVATQGCREVEAGFTGHVEDAATGLTYMQQRYYDPSVGLFLSVDPVAVDVTSGGNFNRYRYASNNPFRFIDPDGRLDREAKDFVRGAKAAERARREEIESSEAIEPLYPESYFVAPLRTARTVGNMTQRVQRRDNGKNERHGDNGRATAKAQARIAELKKKLETAVGSEAKKIEQKIKNIVRDAQRKGKGEEHSRRAKK